MTSKIINLHNSENYTSWQQTIAFCKDWESGETEFELNTSGSTGHSKTIKISRQQMITSAQQTILALNLSSNDRLLVCINARFIGGKMMLVRGMVGGMSIFITEPSSNPLKNVSSNFDFMAVVPMQLQTMIQEKEDKKLNAMKCIIVGGAPISKSLQLQIEQLKVPIYGTYGMTETVSHIALKKLNGNDKSNYYKIIGDVIIGSDDRECLTINGSVTNSQTIITNDIVRKINDQNFEWLGRHDNIINSGGIKISPEQVEKEIENLFDQIKIKRRFFIYGLEDEKLGEKVVLFIEGKEFDVRHLNSTLKNGLQKYQCPKSIIFVREFSITATGKTIRKSTIKKLDK